MQKIVPNVWFDTEGHAAADFYTSVFENSRITNVTHYGEAGPRPAGTVLTVEFELEGQKLVALNGPDGQGRDRRAEAGVRRGLAARRNTISRPSLVRPMNCARPVGPIL